MQTVSLASGKSTLLVHLASGYPAPRVCMLCRPHPRMPCMCNTLGLIAGACERGGKGAFSSGGSASVRVAVSCPLLIKRCLPSVQCLTCLGCATVTIHHLHATISA